MLDYLFISGQLLDRFTGYLLQPKSHKEETEPMTHNLINLTIKILMMFCWESEVLQLLVITAKLRSRNLHLFNG